MDTIVLIISFLSGLVFVLLYYRWVWNSTKLYSKELKLISKYGKDSPIRKRFRNRYIKFYHSRWVRFLIFILYAYAVFIFFGKSGLEGFFFALIVGNLFLFPWGWKKSLKNT